LLPTGPDGTPTEELSAAIAAANRAWERGQHGEAVSESGTRIDWLLCTDVDKWDKLVKQPVSLSRRGARVGGDTDTIAAIAGQIAGARLGSQALPMQLFAQLPEHGEVQRIVDRFAEVVSRRSAGS
jgi:hypothetical protein